MSEPVRVSVRMGFKRSMGNYEMLDIAVEVEDSAREDESAAKAFDRVYGFVERKIVEKFGETEEQLSKSGLGQQD